MAANPSAMANQRNRRARVPRRGQLLSSGRLARIEEGLLRRMELVGSPDRQLERCVEPDAAIELIAGPTGLFPRASVDRQPAVQSPSSAILLEPRPEPRPLAQQCLVRDLGPTVIHRHEPVAHEGVQHDLLRRCGDELVERCASAHIVPVLAELGEAQQHAAEGGALFVESRS